MVDQAKSFSSSKQQQPNSTSGEEMSLVELRRLGRSLRREYLIRSHETATRRILQKSRSILSSLRTTTTTVADSRASSLAATNYYSAKRNTPLTYPPSSSSLPPSDNGLRAVRANARKEMPPTHTLESTYSEDPPLLPCKVKLAFKAPINMWDFLRAKAELLHTDDEQLKASPRQPEDKTTFMSSLKNLIKTIHPSKEQSKPSLQQSSVSKVYDWSGQVRMYSVGAALTPHNLHAGRWTKECQRFANDDDGHNEMPRRRGGVLANAEFVPDEQFLSFLPPETSIEEAVHVDPVCVIDVPLSCALLTIPFTYECVDFTQRVLKDLILHFNHASVSSNLLRKATLKPKLSLDDLEHLALTVWVPTVLEMLLQVEEGETRRSVGKSRTAGGCTGVLDGCDEDIRASVTSVGEDRELTWEQCKNVQGDLILFLPQTVETTVIHLHEPLQFKPQAELIRALLDLDQLGVLSRISFFHHPIFRDRKVAVFVGRFLRSKRTPNQIRWRRESRAYLLRVGTIYEPFATTVEDEEDGENL